jgi:hypothetical protein
MLSFCVSRSTSSAVSGDPARYAEGYIIKPSDFSTMKNEGEMDTVDVTDARGHAWVEVYIDGYGWYPLRLHRVMAIPVQRKQQQFLKLDLIQFSRKKFKPKQAMKWSHHRLITQKLLLSMKRILKVARSESYIIVLLILAAAGAAIFAAVLRRYIILLNRRYRFSLSITNKAALYIYKYFKKILFFSGIEKGSETYEEFCRRIRQSSDLFDNDMSDTIINLALKANYSGQQVTDEAISEAVKAVQIITCSVYKSLKWYKKIVYKYLLCLI